MRVLRVSSVSEADGSGDLSRSRRLEVVSGEEEEQEEEEGEEGYGAVN